MNEATEINTTTKTATREPLGISEFLPKPARDALVAAAREAQGLSKYSYARVHVIGEASSLVMAKYPEFFKKLFEE